MRSAIARITLKIIELLGCIACFIAKVITDLEARRVFLRNQKYSREWSLVHNVTWSTAGNTFANITYGGFSLITTLMLISRCIDANSRPSLIEKIFLIVGMLCFFAMGGLVLAAFDQVPWELHDNSIILGCLSFFVALIMLYDLSDPMARHVTDMTQTDNVYANPTPSATVTQANQTETQSENSTNINSSTQIHRSAHTDSMHDTIDTSTNVNANNNEVRHNGTTNESNESNDHQINERNITYTQVQTIQSKHMQPLYPVQQHHHHHHQMTNNNNMANNTTMTLDSPDVMDITRNGHYHRSDNIDFVHMQHLPQAEQPVFERILLPEKKRPTFNKVTEPHSMDATVIQTVHSSDGYIESHIRSMDYLDDNNVNYTNDHNHNVQKRNTPKYGNSSLRQQLQKQQPKQYHSSVTANTVLVSQQQQQQQQHQKNQQRQWHHNDSSNANGIGNNNINRTIYAKPSQQLIYKTKQSYAYDENLNSNDHRIDDDDDDGNEMTNNIGPKYTMNGKNGDQTSSNDLNRYKDAANVIHDQLSSYQHKQQPMMVIRNYNNSQIANPNMNVKSSKYNHHQSTMSIENQQNYSTTANNWQSQLLQHHQHQQQHPNLTNSTRKYDGISTNVSIHGTRSGSRMYNNNNNNNNNQCCQNDSDEPVDFRKMNAAMRPGYVASAAKMWDQRVAEKSTELNTIV